MEINKSGYRTVRETADAWGVTKRYVNLCIESGRIFGVVKMGNIWVIPKSAPKPVGRSAKLRRECLLSDLSGVVTATARPMPGNNPDGILETVKEDRLRFIYEGQIAYLRGDFERTIRCFREVEGDGGDAAVKLCAGSIAMAAATSVGDYPLFLEVETFLKGVAAENEDNKLMVSSRDELARFIL